MAELDLEAIKEDARLGFITKDQALALIAEAERLQEKESEGKWLREQLHAVQREMDLARAEVARLRAEREGRDLDPEGIEPLLDDMLTREFGFTYEYRATAKDEFWGSESDARDARDFYRDEQSPYEGVWIERRLVGPPERIEEQRDAD